MLRWEQDVYMNGEKQYTRSEKKGLKELKKDLSFVEYTLMRHKKVNGKIIKEIEAEVQQMQKSTKTKEERKELSVKRHYLNMQKKAFVTRQKSLQKEIRNLKEKIRVFEENKNPSHKGFHHKAKKRSNEQIREIVLDYIKKEDIARLFEVKESQVEQVFRQLNLEGILNQPIHYAPHDSQRDPWGYDGNMAWMGDLYYLRHKNEEAEDCMTMKQDLD